MSKTFSLSTYPWVYKAKYQSEGLWKEDFEEKPHKTPAEEAALDEEGLTELLNKRNSFPDLPLVNYTTQYGFGCFEGLKAYPWKDGTLRLFRPDENVRRMNTSLKGLYMPTIPEDMLLKAILTIVKKNKDLGFAPLYDPAWEKNHFVTGSAVYIRPFSYSEPGIGVNLSYYPWIIVVTTPVGAYFDEGASSAVTTELIRATPKGTGCLKTNSNYVISALAKDQAIRQGYMECVFLDAIERKYVEEGSSSNIFFLLKSGVLVTPALGDTILPGVTRKSIITLAQEKGIKVEERRITIDEALSDSAEAFVSGTAAGITYLDSLTHQGKKVVFNNGKMGPVAQDLLNQLKGIQYGAIEDTHGWIFKA
jgi:branched-chain amino acid aminotransferase